MTGRGRWIAAAAGAAAAGAAFVWWRDRRRTESPSYTIEASEGPVELRRYPALVVAETVQPGQRDRALGNGFGVLTDYMFGEARGHGGRRADPLPMTLPVIALPADGQGWRVRFVMPEGRAIETLPAPGAGIALTTLPARRMAALRFTGAATDRVLAQKEAELRAWAARRGLTVEGPAEHDFYNSPMIPGPLRHTEVQLAVADRKENET